MSREWIPDFANFRRDGYDFDARWDDGLASYKDKEIYEAITGEGRMLSKRLKEALNYRKGGNIGFETLNTSMYIDNIKVTKLHDELGGDYDNYVCGLWDQKEPEYIAEQGVPYYPFTNENKGIWSGFDDRR